MGSYQIIGAYDASVDLLASIALPGKPPTIPVTQQDNPRLTPIRSLFIEDVTTGDLLIPGFQQEFTNDNTGMGAKPIWTGRRLLISQSPTELLNYETVLVSSGRNSLPEPFTHHDTHDACVPYIVKRMSFH